MLKKIYLFIAVALLSTAFLHAQVTTSSITGKVVDASLNGLQGATVTAVHEPTGSRYTTTSQTGGLFTLPNIAPGGPYTVSVTYVGYADYSKSEITVPLGDKYDISVELTNNAAQLETVVVTGVKSSIQKTGASTNISRRQVLNVPNPGRTLTGLSKLTPQSNGNSFAGMNQRYNNITIDGSVFNNNFGRSGDGMVPGGAAAAISLDAIDQLQVNIAPFDVRQAGFVGGGINAVTRRGTNNFYASAYGYFKPESFYGKKVKDQTVSTADLSRKVYGASIGGPIIKNKLFFFVNAEKEKSTRPGQTWLASRPGENDNNPQATKVLASDLEKLSSFLQTEYNYQTGAYEKYNFGVDNYKILGRLDWNINDMHKLSLRYTQSETNDDDQVNTSSVPSPAGRISNGRRGTVSGGMAYANTNFLNNTIVKSGVLELNSVFNSKLSNQLLVSYTDNQPKRVPNSNAPFVDIMKDANNVYISFGTDLFSYQNYIVDKAFNAAENLTLNLGKHNLVFGASFDHMEFQNSFTSGAGGGYYRYASLQDFLDKKAPNFFAVAYDPSNPMGIAVPSAKFNQLGVYVQDIWSPVSNFKLTYGLRVDQPNYPYTPPRNPALEQITFADENGNPEKFDVSKFPDSKMLISPRVGFTYDVLNNKSLVVRGGTGIFTGRIPFIWLVNQVGDNGVIRAQYTASGAELADIRYSTDRTKYIPSTVPPVGTTIPSGSSYSATVKDFKMPQVWRSNLAVEKTVATNTIVSLEAIYTKMINNVYYRNANLGTQAGTLGGVADKRPIYNTRLNADIAQMNVLDNINKGYSFALTPMIQKSFANGWEAMLAYTYTIAKDVAIGSSDQAGSGWTTNNISGNPNKPELGYSNYSVPHRIVASASYRFDYLNKKMATTVGVYYAGSSQDRYSYRYGGDINGDNASNDIIYIPKSASEITFVEGYTVGGKTYTAQEQSDAFFKYVENDKYLKNHKGQYMERYGAVLPWNHALDLRVLQDFYVYTGSKKHTLQLSADLTNFLNLLNKDWGYRYFYNFGTFQDQALLGLPSSTNNTGKEGFNKANPKYTFNPTITKVQQPDYSVGSTWGLQIGIRYIFN
ncbi:carboxypeptidase regulatory-like domain-containing protein [Niabella pedocola]|uniref:Carboxypeptidase regulatory-like domain-containing protein n=1 Tax=Niabella pedocola TaxID=1752077 RepID=A0ABS8Q1V9_9BACT|nr:carboxypeptidase regulatory-like domain-containing protein [Niabella pedocola]MCD2426201.1 carboxypeptidase regulatory-like domain-containing protein [Niabella pedocola]